MHHTLDDDPDELALDRAATALRRAERVTVLTGAGVSAESGIATFRGAGGLWEGHRVEEVATPEAFHRQPDMVWRFYNQRRASLRTVVPNPGHHALVRMEERWSDGFTLVTQNVDGLHRVAGSQRLLEIHGSLTRVRCTGCHDCRERGLDELPALPTCDICGALLRPDVVWFHEMLPEEIWLAADAAAASCHCFLVVGTSGIVYPAAGLIDTARAGGASVIEVNLEPTGAGGGGVIGLYGPSGVLLPRLLARLT